MRHFTKKPISLESIYEFYSPRNLFLPIYQKNKTGPARIYPPTHLERNLILRLGILGADRRFVQLGKLNILIHIFGGIAGIAVMFALSNVQSIAVQNANTDVSQTSALEKSLSKETKLPDQKTPFGFIKTLQAACLPRHFFHSLLAIRPSLLPWIKPVFISSSFSFLSFFFLPFLIKIHFRLLSCESPRAPPRRSVVSF